MWEEKDVRRREGTGWGRWVGAALLVLAAAFFSFLNAGERVTIDVGFTTLYRVSLVGLVFAVFLLGMVAMFLFGLRHDRQIRNALRARQPYGESRQYDPFDPPADIP